MDYFIVSEDRRVVNRIKPRGISKSIFDERTLDETTPIQFYIEATKESDYVDFIERPVPLVSDRLRKVLQMYHREIVFAPVVLTDLKRALQKPYWYFKPPQIKCISNRTEFYKNETIKKLVINQRQTAGYRVLQVNHLIQTFILFDLMVVESLLRRGFTGFRLERIEVE
jgi:hypothetical protein